MTFEQYAMQRLPVLLGTARAICADDALAEDLVQDVLIKLHARWSLISSMDAPDAYVRRMLVNEYLSWRRKWLRTDRALVARQLPESIATGADFASRQAERADLLAEVRRLPARQRAVIGLRYFADLTDAEIADLLGCRQSTVRVHAARALKALRIGHIDQELATTDGAAS
ncbi:MAG TPA: SigE family RNA polymerase sigma factor [Jatrophihabitans sp.]|nr:SigE family RNA polymerase sigma factor [Jatrophihabitans sp.]